MSRLLTFLLGAAAGAAASHFLDPESGRRRRSEMREQAVSKVQSGAGQAATTASHAAHKAKGVVSHATPTGTRLEDPDDVTLARKVETEIFRAADAPKGDVSVNADAGVVYLRGTAEEPWIARLADEAGKVEGVKGVKNLLHRPGTPAPAPEPRGTVTDRAS